MPPNCAQRRKVDADASALTAAAECPAPAAAVLCAAPPHGSPRKLAVAAAAAPPQVPTGPLLLDALPSDFAAALFDLIPVDQRLALRLICKGWQRWLGATARAWAKARRGSASRAFSARASLVRARGRAARAHRARRRATDARCRPAVRPEPREPIAHQVFAGHLGRRIVRLTLPDAGTSRLLAGDGDTPLLPAQVLAACTRHLAQLRGACAASPVATQWTPAQLRRLAAAAPALALAQLDVRLASADEAFELFAAGCGLHAALRLRTLHVSPSAAALDCPGDDALVAWSAEALRALCAAAAAAGVHALQFCALAVPLRDRDALAALCAAAAASGLRRLGFVLCGLEPGSWAALAQAVLPHGALQELTLAGDPLLRATSEEVAPFTAALRASRLQRLHLELAAGPGADGAGPAAAAALLAAAAGHVTLRSLSLRVCPAIRGAPQEALGAALAAAAATLHDLDLSHCELGDDVIAPLLAAITQPGCALRCLTLAGCRMSEAFQRGALLAAAHNAAPALRGLLVADADRNIEGKWWRVSAAAIEAQGVVLQRAAGPAPKLGACKSPERRVLALQTPLPAAAQTHIEA